jgi:hypothetical protein
MARRHSGRPFDNGRVLSMLTILISSRLRMSLPHTGMGGDLIALCAPSIATFFLGL